MGAEQSKRSKVCWSCYGSNGTQQCPSCNRYFHSGCLTRSELAAKRTWTCIVCNKLKSSEQTVDKETDLKTLPVLINGLLQKELFAELENSLDSAAASKSDDVRSFKNILDSIKGSGDMSAYTSFDAFNIDVNWILDRYKAIFEDDETNVHIVELLKDVVKEEIDGLRKCSSCYANAHAHPENWFTMVCEEPHIVAWAKFQGCNFWPVKIMSVVGRKLSVRFFGDHTHADIAATKCYQFSEESPAGKAAKSRGSPYQNALQEANVYIDNIKKKFGTFNYGKKKTAIDPTSLADYALQMIPGTGILHTINPLYNNDDGAEVSSSSNVTTGSGSNSSLDTTMDSSLNSQNANDATRSPDPMDIEPEQPAKKPRLSSTAAAECSPMDHTNDDGKDVDNSLEAGTTASNDDGAATISLELFEQMRNANLSFELQLKQMTKQLNEKACDNERLQLQNQALVNENVHLKTCLEEKTDQISKAAEAAAQQQTSPHQIDRIALIELAKTTKICAGCNTERPSDMLHFCDIGCQKSYLKQLGN